MIRKLLGVAMAGNTSASVEFMQRFLLGITKIIILAIICAFMLCSFLAILLTLAYFGLIGAGLDPFEAGVAVAVAVLFLTAGLLLLAADQIRTLRNKPHLRLSPQVFPRVRQIAGAFLDGFASPGKKI